MDSLVNKHDLLYTDKKGNAMGCGFAVECPTMDIFFYEIVLDKTTNRIRAKGRIIYGAVLPDTSGVFGYIYLARPSHQHLSQVRVLSKSYLRHRNDTHENAFPFQMGDFQIDFRFNKKDRLYFDSPMYRPREYKIGLLLK
jgi:hypothetical protein